MLNLKNMINYKIVKGVGGYVVCGMWGLVKCPASSVERLKNLFIFTYHLLIFSFDFYHISPAHYSWRN